MARPLRVEFEGAYYHVTARGNEWRPVFRDDEDRRRFLAVVGEACVRFGLAVHGYCLMGNHPPLSLSKGSTCWPAPRAATSRVRWRRWRRPRRTGG